MGSHTGGRLHNVPPLAELDGTTARTAATDAAQWSPVESADGHTFWFPPELEYIAHGMDMSWTVVAGRLQQALAIREMRTMTHQVADVLSHLVAMTKELAILRRNRKGRPPEAVAAALAEFRRELLAAGVAAPTLDRAMQVVLERGREHGTARQARRRASKTTAT